MWLTSGAAAGMAAMVTPNSGALAMLAAAVPLMDIRRQRAKFVVYAVGCALAPVGLLLYLAAHHALGFAFDDVIRFPLERYASVNKVPYGYGIYTPLTYVFPTAALMAALVWVRNWRFCLHDRLFWTCAAFCLAGLVGCFPRPDTSRISYIVPLALPLLAYCTIRLAQSWKRPKGSQHRCLVAAITAIVIWVGAPPAYFFVSMVREALRGQTMSTPRGSATLILGLPGISKIVARSAATPRTDAYFFYPTPQMLSFLTAREQVSKYDALVPNYVLPSQYRDACISVMQHASWVVINRYSMDPTKLKLVFPAMRDLEPKERKQFEQALEHNFKLVAQEGVFELRQRRKGINESICAHIAD